jgi:hypothetical protein
MSDHELATHKRLKSELTELGNRYLGLKDDSLFVLWFLRAYVTDDEQKAADAICGGARDKSVDALVIDERSQSAFIVQGKYRGTVGKQHEDRAAVMQVASLADVLFGQDGTFSDFVSNASPQVTDLLREARKHLLRRHYRLWLYYVTLGRCSPGLRKEAERAAARSAPVDRCHLQVFDGRGVLSVLRDYLDGVAPPVPALDLEIETGAGVRVTEALQRYDHGTRVESWVFPMRSHDVAKLYDLYGIRLFARNIRGFFGNSPVNQSMVATLEEEPEHFFYYNNGITIVCDQAEKVSSQGRAILRVGNPQIINGQQTVRVLAAHDHLSRTATALVRVMVVPRGEVDHADSFDALVSKIVAGTNWQNKILQSDLMANDRRQVEIERELRKRGYLYLRKRMSKQEAKRAHGSQWRVMLTKEDLALAGAACDLDPLRARAGKEHLFSKELYSQIFPNSDADHYLPRYWLMRAVTHWSRGYATRAYAKWLVLNFMWYRLTPLLRASSRAQAFSALRQKGVARFDLPLGRAIEAVFKTAERFHRANRGTGEKALDPSSFYKNRSGLHRKFREFWETDVSAAQEQRFDRLLERMRDALDSHAEMG